MSRWPILVAACLVSQSSTARAPDPFAFLAPTVRFTAADRGRLDRGTAVVRVLPSESGEIAIVAAVPIAADRQRFVSWIRQVAALKKSDFVREIARFSDPPALADLDRLTLDDDDLEAIRRCGADDCDLNLGRDEIAALREAVPTARGDWKDALQQAFRRLVLARVRGYLAAGQRTVPQYVGASSTTEAAFAAIVAHTPFLEAHLPDVTRYALEYPRAPPPPHVESFLYWSKEALGGRPTTTLTHVVVDQPDSEDLPEVIVAGKQVFATHYTTGALNITALTRASPGTGRYLVYFNRSRVDVLEHWYGGVARFVIERRIKSEAAEVLQGLRHRIEGGDPPGGSVSGGETATRRTPPPRESR
ncbi:MAG TPA: hypothetical protein VLT86_00900 [Vicinamibacterales bacterium]|nr:hypothetical protein [Vicinamibacterales bacterium]